MAAQMTSSATRYEPKMLHTVKLMAKKCTRTPSNHCIINVTLYNLAMGNDIELKSPRLLISKIWKLFSIAMSSLKTLTVHDDKISCSNLKCQLSEATWLAKSCTECWIRGQLFNFKPLKSLKFGKVCHGTPLASLWEVLMESSPGHQVAAAGEMMGMRSSYWRTEVRVK